MKVLLDPGIFLFQESDQVISNNIKYLLKILKQGNAEIIIHPLSIEYLERYIDELRRQTIHSEIQEYPLLEAYPDPKMDRSYLNAVRNSTENKNNISNIILYSVYKDSVDFLITEDRSIHKKASGIGIDDRVLLIDEALQVFINYIPEYGITAPSPLKNELVKNLDLEDPIFDTLKEEYPEFQNWFEKIASKGRRSWVYYRNDGSIGALLIYKVEDEPIDCTPSIPEKKRLKISTLKVTHVGYKIGELFIKLATDVSLNNNLSEIYLTHFTRPDDRLIELISEFGFYKVCMNSRGEEVFIKKLIIDKDEVQSLSPIDVSKKFYPSFYDGGQVKKFVVPIRPEYHNMLFTDFPGRQTTLLEHAGEFIVEGNTIKKAYLSHSNIRRMGPGDLILFYRSEDLHAITSIGVVEAVYTGIEDADQIVKLVGKRTVFSRKEIDELVKKPVSIFLFRHHFHLDKRLSLNALTEAGILTAAPQSVMQISPEGYIKIKEMGGIDEHFTID
jgi:hypothetical protein